ncbi:hypothetical protein L1049_023061 [Liquidambar formosana]|uniref:Uncharacterized protein n=1 Tax=Liquidambar formosana TaxID=63359 RepID=A0AAP0REY3_LIQFO
MMDDGDDKRRASSIDSRFTEILFSWSLEDIFNENLHANQYPCSAGAQPSSSFPPIEELRHGSWDVPLHAH